MNGEMDSHAGKFGYNGSTTSPAFVILANLVPIVEKIFIKTINFDGESDKFLSSTMSNSIFFNDNLA